jgi:serine/threonine-protein kinase
VDRQAHPVEQLLCAGCCVGMRELEQPVPGYRLLRELGRGGMGVVYLAASERNGRLVAVKTITPDVPPTDTDVAKFLREAAILRDLNHPNIVRFREMSSCPGKFWFAMDYVRGTDARRLLREHGPLPISRAIDVMSQILSGLEAAHAKRFVHRDIKPANVLLTQRDGRESALLADFGLARVYQASSISGLTVTGEVGGTPFFIPPEQITDYREAAPPADQYATAMTLYKLLTGHYAYDPATDGRPWFVVVLQDEPVPIRTRRPELPSRLAGVIHKALAKDPQKRFTDVREFRKALQAFSP